MLSSEAAKWFREIDDKERLVVGVNHLAIPEEEEEFELPIQEVHATIPGARHRRSYGGVEKD